MKIIASFFLTYLLFVVQLALIPYLAIAQATPNLILISLVGLLFLRRLTTGAFLAGFGGLLYDLYSPFRFGIYTLVFLLIYVLSTTILRRYLSQGSLLAFLGVMLVALAIGETFALLATADFRIFVGNIAYGLLIALVGYLLVSLFRERTLKI